MLSEEYVVTGVTMEGIVTGMFGVVAGMSYEYVVTGAAV